MRRFIEKKNIFFLLVLIGIFGISFSVFALRPPLELNWPESPGGIDLNNKNIIPKPTCNDASGRAKTNHWV